MSDYGKTIKEIRKVYGYTQTQLAKATNIVQQNLSAWENQTLISAYGLPTFRYQHQRINRSRNPARK